MATVRVRATMNLAWLRESDGPVEVERTEHVDGCIKSGALVEVPHELAKEERAAERQAERDQAKAEKAAAETAAEASAAAALAASPVGPGAASATGSEPPAAAAKAPARRGSRPA